MEHRKFSVVRNRVSANGLTYERVSTFFCCRSYVFIQQNALMELVYCISVSLAYVYVRPLDIQQFCKTHGKSVRVDISGAYEPLYATASWQ